MPRTCYFGQFHPARIDEQIDRALGRYRTPARALTVSFAQSTEEVDEILDQEALDNAVNEQIAREFDLRHEMDKPVLLVFCPACRFIAVA